MVDAVTSGEAGVAAALRERPDVVLMDLGLPDQSGLAAGAAILAAWPGAKVLALTALSDRALVEEAIRLGFRGYLTKDTPVAQFANALRSVVDGQQVLPHRLAPASGPSREDGHAAFLAAQLTQREREVLGLLVQGSDGRSIARHLAISQNTVRTHVQSILTKLQVHSRLEAATFAVRHKIVHVPGAADGGASAASVLIRSS